MGKDDGLCSTPAGHPHEEATPIGATCMTMNVREHALPLNGSERMCSFGKQPCCRVGT